MKNQQRYRYHFFRADDYTVVMETLRMKYGTKKIRRRATEIEISIDFRFKIGVG